MLVRRISTQVGLVRPTAIQEPAAVMVLVTIMAEVVFATLAGAALSVTAAKIIGILPGLAQDFAEQIRLVRIMGGAIETASAFARMGGTP